MVVLKLNGGLGTGMGCTGPKSCIPVRGGDTFISLILEQLETLNKRFGVSVPLVFMTSFSLSLSPSLSLPLHPLPHVFMNSFSLSLSLSLPLHPLSQLFMNSFSLSLSLSLSPSTPFIPGVHELLQHSTGDKGRGPEVQQDGEADKDDPAYYYPPGHGDCLRAFKMSGLAEQFHSEGREWTFISNVDNLGATVDLPILQYLSTTKYDFMPELTPKTALDVKGGTVVSYHGALKLLELAQVPPEHVNEFKNIERFDTFNTNNNYVRLSAL
ncbi:UTP--glucose-1-phosphate uridylyltransferase family protein, partial [Kipferlia bialata]|eukprot:g12243.t1